MRFVKPFLGKMSVNSALFPLELFCDRFTNHLSLEPIENAKLKRILIKMLLYYSFKLSLINQHFF